MLISISAQTFNSASSLLSLRTFFKHVPTIKPSTLRLRHFLAGEAIVSRASVSSFTSTAAAVGGTPNFEALTSHQQHQVRLYIDSLLQWNQKMNLTAVKEENEVMERHVEDSLAIIVPVRESYVPSCGSSFENLSVVDVGSGAGLPGLILAIACPSWKVTLLESLNKRCVFLEHVVSLIGLENVWIVRNRAENVGQILDYRERFDIAVARAVAEMRVLAEYCLPLVRVGGLFVAAKGHDPQEEVVNAERAIRLMGASLLQTCFVESHSKYGQRTAIICLKNSSTPRKYPRAPESQREKNAYIQACTIDSDTTPKALESITVFRTRIKQLTLNWVKLTSEGVKYFVANCPLLEGLSLSHCKGLSSLEIIRPSPSFKWLEIYLCHNVETIVVRDSNLVTIKYSGKGTAFVLRDVPLLTHLWVDGVVLRSLDNVAKMFASVLQQIQFLLVHFLGPIYYPQSKLSFEMRNLKQLVVRSSNTHKEKDSLQPFVNLISASPFLERFAIEIPRICGWADADADADAAVAVGGQRQKKNRLRFLHLEEVKFVGYRGTIAQLELIKLLVGNAAVLRTVIVDPSSFDVHLYRPWRRIRLHEFDKDEMLVRAHAEEQLKHIVPHKISLKIL